MKPLTKAGIVLGLGMGGFVDGIVLHQILGWHHLVCLTETCQPDTVAALKVQNTQDGFFHLVVWVFTLAGIFMLFRAMRDAPLGRTVALVGPMLAGWGLFNVVEGAIDHHLLGIHHVRPGHDFELLWDLAFLASGVLFILVGWTLTRAGATERPEPARSTASA